MGVNQQKSSISLESGIAKEKWMNETKTSNLRIHHDPSQASPDLQTSLVRWEVDELVCCTLPLVHSALDYLILLPNVIIIV